MKKKCTRSPMCWGWGLIVEQLMSPPTATLRANLGRVTKVWWLLSGRAKYFFCIGTQVFCLGPSGRTQNCFEYPPVFLPEILSWKITWYLCQLHKPCLESTGNKELLTRAILWALVALQIIFPGLQASECDMRLRWYETQVVFKRS